MAEMQSPQALQDAFGIDDKAVFTTGQGGLTKVTLTSQGSSAELYIHGAHLTDYTPAGHQPVLFVSSASEFSEGKPIRGGVPICWPWFGPRHDGEGPGHGFARLSEWTLTDTTAHDDGRVSMTLELKPNDLSRQLWDHDFDLTLTVTLGDRLEMAMTTTHAGSDSSPPFAYTEALHSYFSVADIHKVQITGLEHNSYIDKMRDGSTQVQGEEPIRFEGETDRVYQGPTSQLDQGSTSTCVCHDPAMGRRIVIEKEGSKSTVVWNPWVDKAGRMEDFGDDEWPGMLCVETANALDHAITLKPGESHTIVARLRVEAAQ